MELEAGCSVIIQKAIPQKSCDPGSFTLPITIGNLYVGKALLDLGASINLIPLSMLKRMVTGQAHTYDVAIDRSIYQTTI